MLHTMKKIIITFFLSLLSLGVFAQISKGAKFVFVSQAKSSTVGAYKYTIQVGIPLLGQTKPSSAPTRSITPADVRFPWDILYLYNTFSEEFFDVSKGYFGDKILISWVLNNNDTKSIEIFRREYSPLSTKNWGTALANLASSVTSYEDKYVEGGVLYEYKVHAIGLNESEILYGNYITGVGFRSPTAIVTGNINYKGGNPVKDVIVQATSSGGGSGKLTALMIPDTSQLLISNINKKITGTSTLQAWVKPVNPFTDDAGAAIRLFKIGTKFNLADTINVTVNLKASSKILEVNIGGSLYQLKNYYPSGTTNARGDDELTPVSSFNTNFVHFSVILNNGKVPTLFINGRPISDTFRLYTHNKLVADTLNYTAPYFLVVVPAQVTTLASAQYDNITVGGIRNSYIDEIRVWNAAVDTLKIRTDFKRFISGNHANLVSYLSANEGAGNFAYDLSRTGFVYNKNNGILGEGTIWTTAAGTTPTSTQLGVLGVTDANGNYEITSIPYSGVGESFTITPMYGQHKFEATQQLVYLGQGSEVANKIDFIDKSSFSFKGKLLYDSRGVFPSFVDDNKTKTPNTPFATLTNGDQYISGTDRIFDEGYNYYQKGVNKYSKGEYWMKNKGTVSLPDYYLERYGRVYVEGAYVYVDGNMVLDANNLPVVSDKEGFFDVSVPIGNHAITVKKDGHGFVYGGRYPAASNSFKEFFEDLNEPVVFVDTTKVIVVGKVVGGSVEAGKKIGFGENGLKTQSVSTNATGGTSTIEVSAKNNMGVAQFVLGYKPGGSAVDPTTSCSFATNKHSGEYRMALLPLQYELLAAGLTIPTQTPAIPVLKATEILDFTKVDSLKTPSFKYLNFGAADSSLLVGKPYHYEKNFIHRSTPVLRVTTQSSDPTILVGGVEMPTTGFADPVYTQFHPYQIELKRFERYTNYDSMNTPITREVPVTDGQLMFTNNLALANNSETVTENATDKSIITYQFQAGLPSIVPPFTKTISLQYIINGNPYPVEGLKTTGIILGGASDGSQTFVTAAPDIPAIILRDPPGSNSFATIEKGESISFTSEASFAHKEGFLEEVTIGAGVSFSLQGGLVPTPKVEIETTNSGSVGIGLANTSKDGKSVNSTYTFNKAISTSDATDYVGAGGDLYIGNSKNIFYGSYDNIQTSNTIPNTYVNGVASPLPAGSYVNLGTVSTPIYLSKQKALSFVDKPTETFFVYSQKHILSTLIPEYELFIATNLNGPTPNSVENINKRAEYAEKIRLWKKVILDNEKSKWLARNNRVKYKQKISNILTNFNNRVNTTYDGISDPVAKSKLTNQLSQSNAINGLLNTHFEKNISFDAGVGDYAQSTETSVVSASTTSYDLTIDESVGLKLGTSVNKVGIEFNTSAFFQQDINSTLSQESTNTANISYTLKDNDPANFLSVDVVNAFDGNGPVFSTLGGRSSCPYEGEEKSQFYPDSTFRNYFNTLFSLEDQLAIKEAELIANQKAYYLINPNNIVARNQNRNAMVLLTSQKTAIVNSIQLLNGSLESRFDLYINAPKAPLNYATQKVEVPILAVTNNYMTNVLEGKKAEFELKLTNNSAAGVDAVYKLVIDNTTNPNNALINIEPNGTLVNVPYGKEVIYKMTLGKSISDVYTYDSIKVRLESLCDGETVSSSVYVSAKFVPSCSQVIVSVPLSNWVYNRETAYNADRTTKPLLINLIGFSTNFASFKKIDLEYRLSTAPNWTRLHTYYKTTAFLNAGTETSEKDTIGSQTTLSYAFDMAKLSLPDGVYEIRARSSCTNNTEFISDLSTGRVDLTAPVKFGTPLPIDGILGSGEDLKVSFNEPVTYNSAVSLIEIKGQTNQLKIDHNVSLHFEGANSTAVITDPKIASGDFALEYWMKNSTTTASATILNQTGGMKIELANGKIRATISGIIAEGSLAADALFHHYTFTYTNSTNELSIYQDADVIVSKTGTVNLSVPNNEAMVIGGNTFIGNMHDLRIWNKAISVTDAYAKMYNRLTGNEANLVGYWPMDEGRGTIANDKARYKHAVVNASWDIKPRGTSYAFANNQSLKLDNVSYVQLTKEMDATISFWIKTAAGQNATIFSNGKGDGSDINQPGGNDNKWAIHINTAGNLTFNSEGKLYTLTTQSIADDSWHHVSLLFNRQGTLKTLVDAAEVSFNQMDSIGGFSGNRIWLGARGAQDLAGNETTDRQFTGKMDEFQLWNTLRNVEQISRDRYFEVDQEKSIGLLLYARMNEPDPKTGNGPRYFHAYSNNTVISDIAALSAGLVNYSGDAPAIKPERELINFKVNRVISNNDMIIEPDVTDIASLEGQVVDITVHRMFDAANNMQQSPITWTAYYRTNEVSWYADGYNEIVDIVKAVGAAKSFEITLLNKGGKTHPFTISNIPKWLSLSKTSGTIGPDSKVFITATIDKDFTPGQYIENLNLQTDFGFDEKLQITLRVLAKEPNWTVNTAAFDKSMNIVGRIKVDGVFSEDSYDQIAAFYNDTLRGVVKLTYNPSYKQYYAFLTVYSKLISGEKIRFKIWDASQGKIIEATLDGSLTIDFEDNGILGTLSKPVIFANTTLVEQNIPLNKGWTWVSMNVNDPNFSNLNVVTKNLRLETEDRILNGSDFDMYSKNIASPSWSGSISSKGGISTAKMYKVSLANEQSLAIKGVPVDLATWNFPIEVNWNWLPYPIARNQLTTESLAYFDASDGDVIKSQNLFAIYDPKSGWNGTLQYLEDGKGYMLKSTKKQPFKYPIYLAKPMGIEKQGGVESAGVGGTPIENADPNQAPMKSDFKQYAQNMNAVVMLPKGYNELFVYDDKGLLKGIASRKNDAELTYITIYGETPQSLNFHVGDGTAQRKTSFNVGFKGNDVLGTISKPVVLAFVEEKDDRTDNIRIYPNPFDTELTIELRATQSQTATIKLYSINGQVVFAKQLTVEKGLNKVSISPAISNGVYLLQTEMNGQRVVNTVVKQSVSHK